MVVAVYSAISKYCATDKVAVLQGIVQFGEKIGLRSVWSPEPSTHYQTELHPETRLIEGTHYIIRMIYNSVKPFAGPYRFYSAARRRKTATARLSPPKRPSSAAP